MHEKMPQYNLNTAMAFYWAEHDVSLCIAPVLKVKRSTTLPLKATMKVDLRANRQVLVNLRYVNLVCTHHNGPMAQWAKARSNAEAVL